MMRDKKNFAIFILTYNRAGKVITLETLKKANYKGKIYYVVDTTDPMLEDYKKIYGSDSVLVFDKVKEQELFDIGDSTNILISDVFARNASQRMARELGLDYLLQLDDDYMAFMFRFIENNKLKYKIINDFNKVIDFMLDFLENTQADAVAMSQGGDHIGGVNGSFNKGILRKAMNSFFLRTDKPITFIGRLNNDVNTYTVEGAKGKLFLTVMPVMLNQMSTQSNKGGMTETYLDSGTYVKSFFTVMMAPSCVKVGILGPKNKRFHHSIAWENAVPKIISEKYKK